MEWQQRPAKPILTRAWKLPEQLGTGKTCINMAEAVGFILGKTLQSYTSQIQRTPGPCNGISSTNICLHIENTSETSHKG